jgi:hypothetical protein
MMNAVATKPGIYQQRTLVLQKAMGEIQRQYFPESTFTAMIYEQRAGQPAHYMCLLSEPCSTRKPLHPSLTLRNAKGDAGETDRLILIKVRVTFGEPPATTIRLAPGRLVPEEWKKVCEKLEAACSA